MNEPRQLTEEEHAALPWCHVYAQYVWHGEAKIEGTRAALANIRDAIDNALRLGMDAEASAIAADGEGYRIKISVRNLEYLEGQTLPYTAHWANGVGTRAVETAEKEKEK